MRKVIADTHVPPAWRRWGARIALALGIAIVIAYVPWRAGNDEQIDKLRLQLKDADTEIARLGQANARIKREIDALDTDVNAIIDHARDELGMVYPGEVVLRVEEP